MGIFSTKVPSTASTFEKKIYPVMGAVLLDTAACRLAGMGRGVPLGGTWGVERMLVRPRSREEGTWAGHPFAAVHRVLPLPRHVASMAALRGPRQVLRRALRYGVERVGGESFLPVRGTVDRHLGRRVC